jgi:hypothetical protein
MGSAGSLGPIVHKFGRLIAITGQDWRESRKVTGPPLFKRPTHVVHGFLAIWGHPGIPDGPRQKTAKQC